MKPVAIELVVNGVPWSGDVAPRLTLADLLRDHLRLTGTHLGCEQGVCGACTVFAGEQAVRSCLMLAVQAHGLAVTTVEGLAGAEELSSIPEAFVRHRAFQCGFCTPGFVVTTAALKRAGVHPDDPRLRELLGGNICRCTGYGPIVEAVRECLSSE